MAELTSEASEMLERYLGQVRLAMAGGGPEAAAEVEQDVREHVEAALADRPGPVGPGELAAVLERLGPPDQWGSVEPPSWLAWLGQRPRRGLSTALASGIRGRIVKARAIKRRVVLGLILGLVALASLSLIKLAWYELNPQLDVIRGCVGKEVTFVSDNPLEGVQGILTTAHYEWDDKWGFFFLRIDVSGDRGGISTYLGPSELWRVKPL